MKSWDEQIDKITQKFIWEFGELSLEQMNWKVNPNSWSIAQNIDHLIVINKTYFPIIDALKKGTYKVSFLSKIGFIVSFFGKLILKGVQPDRKKKMKTFSMWEPATSEIPDGILKRFEEHQTVLKDLIRSSEEFVKDGVVISSPANKHIVYKLETAFEIILTHERRHFEQAKEVVQLMRKEADR